MSSKAYQVLGVSSELYYASPRHRSSRSTDTTTASSIGDDLSVSSPRSSQWTSVTGEGHRSSDDAFANAKLAPRPGSVAVSTATAPIESPPSGSPVRTARQGASWHSRSGSDVDVRREEAKLLGFSGLITAAGGAVDAQAYLNDQGSQRKKAITASDDHVRSRPEPPVSPLSPITPPAAYNPLQAERSPSNDADEFTALPAAKQRSPQLRNDAPSSPTHDYFGHQPGREKSVFRSAFSKLSTLNPSKSRSARKQPQDSSAISPDSIPRSALSTITEGRGNGFGSPPASRSGDGITSDVTPSELLPYIEVDKQSFMDEAAMTEPHVGGNDWLDGLGISDDEEPRVEVGPPMRQPVVFAARESHEGPPQPPFDADQDSESSHRPPSFIFPIQRPPSPTPTTELEKVTHSKTDKPKEKRPLSKHVQTNSQDTNTLFDSQRASEVSKDDRDDVSQATSRHASGDTSDEATVYSEGTASRSSHGRKHSSGKHRQRSAKHPRPMRKSVENATLSLRSMLIEDDDDDEAGLPGPPPQTASSAHAPPTPSLVGSSSSRPESFLSSKAPSLAASQPRSNIPMPPTSAPYRATSSRGKRSTANASVASSYDGSTPPSAKDLDDLTVDGEHAHIMAAITAEEAVILANLRLKRAQAFQQEAIRRLAAKDTGRSKRRSRDQSQLQEKPATDAKTSTARRSHPSDAEDGSVGSQRSTSTTDVDAAGPSDAKPPRIPTPTRDKRKSPRNLPPLPAPPPVPHPNTSLKRGGSGKTSRHSKAQDDTTTRRLSAPPSQTQASPPPAPPPQRPPPPVPPDHTPKATPVETLVPTEQDTVVQPGPEAQAVALPPQDERDVAAADAAVVVGRSKVPLTRAEPIASSAA